MKKSVGRDQQVELPFMEQSKGIQPRGCVQVYTGDGKGKTTAAIGLAMRAAGAGFRVLFVQFMKAQSTGEWDFVAKCGDRLQVRRFGRPVFIRGTPTPEDIAAARAGLAEAREALISGAFDLVVLDEANMAVYFGLLPVAEVLALIAARPPQVELVLTGRRAAPEVIAAADLVTEMREVKHYATTGLAARRGIEM
jgi:cob(I)alamin adenosyltransferase